MSDDLREWVVETLGNTSAAFLGKLGIEEIADALFSPDGKLHEALHGEAWSIGRSYGQAVAESRLAELEAENEKLRTQARKDSADIALRASGHRRAESQLALLREALERWYEALAPFCDLNHQGNPALRRDVDRARALCAAYDDARGANGLVDDRGTDPEFFAEMTARFGGFNLDVAAAPHNAKCQQFYAERDDGLTSLWWGRVWCNPPYSNLGGWLAKAWSEWTRHNYPHLRPELIVMLLPANRTEQRWWQDHVEPFRDRADSDLSVEFLPGRMRFVKPGAENIGPNERPPFGCCLVIWQRPAARAALSPEQVETK